MNPGLERAFVAMALTLTTLLVVGVYVGWKRTGASIRGATTAAIVTACGTGVWLWGTHRLSSLGLLRFDTVPPTMMIVFVMLTTLAVGLGVSVVGRRLAAGLPLAVLVGAQTFRLPLELMLHRAYESGLMPVQMSYSGFNFDIISGVSAAALSLLLVAGQAGVRAVRLWNALGSLLLLNIVTISLLSAPTPFRVFHTAPPNVWITAPPYIWLPTVMVAFAMLGHIVVFRAVRLNARGHLANRSESPHAASI